MVGRDGELARLRRLRPHGAPEVVLIAGEAGIGKTRLVRELVDSRSDLTTVLWGTTAAVDLGRPLQVALDALAPHVATWTEVPGPLGTRAAAVASLLAPIAPALRPVGAPAPVSTMAHAGAGDARGNRSSPAPDRVGAAVDVVRHLVGGGCALIFVEDLHWADPESVAWFDRLATAPGLDALVVATYRPEDLDRHHPAATVLLDLDRRARVTRVALGRLSPVDVGALLRACYGEGVDRAVADALHVRTGGNPFFLEELIAAAGDVRAEDLAETPLPWSLHEAVLRRLDRAAPEHRRLVEVAALLGPTISFDLLAATAGRTESELIDGLRALVAEGLLVEDRDDVFAFRHALMREAVESQLLARERRRLHERALAALDDLGIDDWSARARHAAGAGRYEELVAAARAGAQASLAQGSAAHALELARTGLAEEPDDLDLLAIAAQAAWRREETREAIRHAERWRDIATRLGDPCSELAALRLLARLYWEDLQDDRQWQALDRAQAVAAALGDPGERALVAVLVGEGHMLADRTDEAVSWAEQAMALAAEPGVDPSVVTDVRVRALVNMGSALVCDPDRRAEAEAVADRAEAEAEAAHDWFNLSRSISNRITSSFGFYDSARAKREIERLARAFELGGWTDLKSLSVLLPTAEVQVIDGDLIGLAATMKEAEGRAPSSGHKPDRGWLQALQARLLLEQGDARAARQVCATILGDAQMAGEPIVTWVASLDTTAAARLGEHDVVLERLAALGAMGASWRRSGPTVDHTIATSSLRTLIDVLLEGFPVDEVVAAHEAVRRRDARFDDRAPGLAALLAGLVAEAADDHAAALDAFRRAVDPAGGGSGLGRRLDAVDVATAHHGAARALLAMGDGAGARAEAEAALALLERWPGWRRDAVTALLDRLDATGRPAAAGAGSAVPSGLTARELEVAALVARGCTNGEIARTLHISTKTASVHVSNILAKLGMAGRAEIAAWAVRQGVAAAAS
jgi:DNA-binding CsgD family transcriptional regulator